MGNYQTDLFSSPEEIPTWASVLREEKESEYFKSIISFVNAERAKGKTVYPPNNDVFSAISLTPFEAVKVVIIGQDPYHGPNQAHGLCFSVRKGIPAPPSLVNIFKEIESDLGIKPPEHGFLEDWAKQGVLLLNASLTVEAHKASSHSDIGWQQFTDKIIYELNARRNGLVFLLWGSFAQKKGQIIDQTRHTVLKAPHPSPLSAHRGFFGCGHFSKTNEILARQGMKEIDWALAE